MTQGDGMAEATEADREKAQTVLGLGGLSRQYLTQYEADTRDAIAAALAEERERERLQWNPMVGRVLQVAQEWQRDNRTIWTDKAAERINDAIRGDK